MGEQPWSLIGHRGGGIYRGGRAKYIIHTNLWQFFGVRIIKLGIYKCLLRYLMRNIWVSSQKNQFWPFSLILALQTCEFSNFLLLGEPDRFPTSTKDLYRIFLRCWAVFTWLQNPTTNIQLVKRTFLVQNRHFSTFWMVIRDMYSLKILNKAHWSAYWDYVYNVRKGSPPCLKKEKFGFIRVHETTRPQL